jgi:hypothetical protein
MKLDRQNDRGTLPCIEGFQSSILKRA